MNLISSMCKNKMIFYVPIMVFCFFIGVAQASAKCDTKKIEVTKGKETVWSGATADLFKKYPHGELGYGNRPERGTVRLSKLIKDIGVKETGKVTVSACRNKSRQLSVAEITSGDIDIWLVANRTGEIRIFEYKKEKDKPGKGFKRIVHVHFSEE